MRNPLVVIAGFMVTRVLVRSELCEQPSSGAAPATLPVQSAYFRANIFKGAFNSFGACVAELGACA